MVLLTVEPSNGDRVTGGARIKLPVGAVEAAATASFEGMGSGSANDGLYLGIS